MSKDAINWKWPSTRANRWNPWYVMLWRLLWIAPLCVSLAVSLAMVFMMHGPREARRFWKENMT